MGTCCSKKTSSSSSPATVVAAPPPNPPSKLSPNPLHTTKKEISLTPIASAPEETVIKKEIFVIKQRRSHERERPNSVTITTATDTKLILAQSPSPSLNNLSSDDAKTPAVSAGGGGGHPVRTSSCTKEEVDAILIQCGRLSRSSSGKTEGSRKYSGSKRSYDFDQDKKTTSSAADEILGGEDKDATSRPYRRTPSRSDRSGNSRHRSSSTSREEERKRNNNQSGSRRLSRSPGRRSETTPLSASSVAAALGGGGDKSKGPPGKMVSVPASTTGAIKRVSVKRATASPRSQSPANAREQPSLSRNGSRKAEHSPYRRNPLSEIDDNQIPHKQQDQQINKKPVVTNYTNKVQNAGVEPNKPFHFQSQNPNEGNVGKTQKTFSEQEEAPPTQGDQIATLQKGAATNENSKQTQTITRSRSSRRSRDLDFLTNGNGSVPNSNDDDVNAPISYASLLLEDIQNFHQKSSSNNTTFSLPPCLTKACSILDAVADLNSSNNSNVSNTLSDERSTQLSNNINNNSSRSVSPFTAHSRKMSCEVVNKDPLVETEVFVYDDLMEPSVHKYITVRRGAAEGGEMEQQESSGSNSFVGQQWLSSSSWEPNSADSTDRWTSSSNTGDDAIVDMEEPHRKRGFSEGARKLRSNGNVTTHVASVSGKKKELDGKIGAASHRAPIAAASM